MAGKRISPTGAVRYLALAGEPDLEALDCNDVLPSSMLREHKIACVTLLSMACGDACRVPSSQKLLVSWKSHDSDALNVRNNGKQTAECESVRDRVPNLQVEQ